MNKSVKVVCGDKTIEFPKETSLLEVAKLFQKNFKFPILIARMNNEIEELTKPIEKHSTVSFYDRTSILGNFVYSRAVHFLMIVAVKHVLGSDVDVLIEHSIDKGIHCTIINGDLNEEILNKIEEEMHRIVEVDYKFVKISVSRRDAIEYFKKKKQLDKVNVLKYISNSYINLYRLDEYYDYFFSEMPYSTKDVNEFKLNYIENNGFVLSYPTIKNPDATGDYIHHQMMFNAFLDYEKMGKTIGITKASDLNEIVSNGKYNDVIRLAEAHYNSQLTRVADDIYNRKGQTKIVLLAGPSSSGKTTTSRKLEIYLKAKGFKTHSISIDDYFLNRDDTPLKANGDYDFESVRALDLDLFNTQLNKLLKGDRVELPEYNFITGKREYNKRYLRLGEDDIVIIEGLHALNDELTKDVKDEAKYKIYICPLTQLNIDNHNRIHTSDTRRLRRMVRDNKYRGYKAADTLKNWKNIVEGEEEYIFPYQDKADVIINSALIYELGVLKTYAEPLLFSVSHEDEAYPEAIRLINFLRNFLPIPSDDIPSESVLREFIGGSCFNDRK